MDSNIITVPHDPSMNPTGDGARTSDESGAGQESYRIGNAKNRDNESVHSVEGGTKDKTIPCFPEAAPPQRIIHRMPAPSVSQRAALVAKYAFQLAAETSGEPRATETPSTNAGNKRKRDAVDILIKEEGSSARIGDGAKPYTGKKKWGTKPVKKKKIL